MGNPQIEAKDTFFYKKTTLNCRGRLLDITVPAVMGILNLTPDSFYDGGKHRTEAEILRHAERMLQEGALIIDAGACSTRPGASEISPEEELKRLIPAIELIRREFPEALVSADTYRARVAREAVQAGASLVNDISAGTFDPDMLPEVAAMQVPYLLMHIRGTPRTMQEDPHYEDVVTEVISFLASRAAEARSHGITDIVLDPGFGFGKNTDHNYSLLKNLDSLHILGYPVLAGVSRKSMINRVIGTRPENALNGTTVIHTLALLKGASILRVHDVKEAVQAVKLVQMYQSR
jgi:dihydropteroate synthase